MTWEVFVVGEWWEWFSRRAAPRGTLSRTTLRVAAPAGVCLASVALVLGPVGDSGLATAATRATDFQHRPVGQAPCPEGKSRSATLLWKSFESYIPWSRFNDGWKRVTTSAPDGSRAARSRLDGSTSDPSDYFFLDPFKATAGRDTRLAFATRGNMPSGKGLVSVNSVLARVTGTSSWSGRIVDITGATNDEGGWLNPWFEQRRTAGTATHWDLDNVQIYTCRANATTRIAGSNRYDTAARVAGRWGVDQDVVYIARGDTFPDALSGAARAGSQGAPILLVRPTSIPDVVKTQLARLNPDRIVILGGTSSVSSAVESALAAYARTSVSRLYGADRYETSAAIASTYVAGKARVYIATGTTYPDALSGAALAARQSVPLLLTRPKSIPSSVADQLTRISPDEIVILGGTSSVSSSVASQLRAYAPTVSRIAGSNRYQTSAAIASKFPRSVSRSYLATGQEYADALTGSALAGRFNAPLLLAKPNTLPGHVREQLKSLDETHGWVLGGQGALASIVRDLYGRTLP